MDFSLNTTRADVLRFQCVPVLGHMAVKALEEVHQAPDDASRALARARLDRVLAEFQRRGHLPVQELRKEEANRVEAFIDYAKRKARKMKSAARRLGDKGGTLFEYAALGGILAVVLVGFALVAYSFATNLNSVRGDVLAITAQPVLAVPAPPAETAAPKGLIAVPMDIGPRVFTAGGTE